MAAPLAFQISELESQMRDCSLHENFEAAITIRDELRKLRAERDEIARLAERPKVIGLFTREEFVPTPGKKGKDKVKKPKKRPVDAESVELLGDVLEEVKKGLVTGLIVMKGIASQSGELVDVHYCTTGTAVDNLTMFLGGMVLAKDDLIGFANDEMEEVDADGED